MAAHARWGSSPTEDNLTSLQTRHTRPLVTSPISLSSSLISLTDFFFPLGRLARSHAQQMDGTEVARGCAQQEHSSQESCQEFRLCSGLRAQDKAP